MAFPVSSTQNKITARYPIDQRIIAGEQGNTKQIRFKDELDGAENGNIRNGKGLMGPENGNIGNGNGSMGPDYHGTEVEATAEHDEGGNRAFQREDKCREQSGNGIRNIGEEEVKSGYSQYKRNPEISEMSGAEWIRKMDELDGVPKDMDGI
ncbi:hypothetical protein P692DRAFT_201810633 [Suillus brevipes Sb2]|nr:hypothetical protein P692DRAFT_201810633 [Suillus brevipes Sb2]